MKAFSEILPQTLKSIGLQRRYNAETVFFHWRDIVGGEIYAHARPAIYRHGVLTVNVDNNVWAHHLLTSKQDMATKINAFVGEKLIKDIKFQAGYLKNGQNEENTDENEQTSLNLKNIVLDEEAVRRADELTKALSDDRLRRRVRRVLLKQEALKKLRQKLQWKKCAACGVLCPPEYEVCTVCGIEQKEAVYDRLRKILLQAPWLSCTEIAVYADCGPADYNTIKNQLIDSIAKEIEFAAADQFKIAMAAMLIHNVKPESITNDLITRTLNKIRGKKHVFASRR